MAASPNSAAPGLSGSSTPSVPSPSRAVMATSPTSFSTNTSALPRVGNVFSIVGSLPSTVPVAAQARAGPAVTVRGHRRAALERAQHPAVDREPLARRALLDPGLELVGQAEGDAGVQLGIAFGGGRVVVDIDQLDVVAPHPAADAAPGQRPGQLASG